MRFLALMVTGALAAMVGDLIFFRGIRRFLPPRG